MDDDKRWLAIGKAVERACMDLPEGYDITISLERDAGSVTLYDRYGDKHDHFGESVESFGAEIDEAIDYALEQSKGMNHG